MRRPLFALGLALALFIPAVAQARPPNEVALLTLLNGEAVSIGVLTSAGASVNNATTAVPFTVVGGSVIKVVCDAESWVIQGATASATITSANLGHPVAAKTPFYMVLKDATTQLAAISTTGTSNCNVARMQ